MEVRNDRHSVVSPVGLTPGEQQERPRGGSGHRPRIGELPITAAPAEFGGAGSLRPLDRRASPWVDLESNRHESDQDDDDDEPESHPVQSLCYVPVDSLE